MGCWILYIVCIHRQAFKQSKSEIALPEWFFVTLLCPHALAVLQIPTTTSNNETLTKDWCTTMNSIFSINITYIKYIIIFCGITRWEMVKSHLRYHSTGKKENIRIEFCEEENRSKTNLNLWAISQMIWTQHQSEKKNSIQRFYRTNNLLLRHKTGIFGTKIWNALRGIQEANIFFCKKIERLEIISFIIHFIS